MKAGPHALAAWLSLALLVSGEDAGTVAMISSGGMARVHAMAFKQVRPIKRIQVYSPNPEHRERYIREISAQLDLEVVPMGRPADSCRADQTARTRASHRTWRAALRSSRRYLRPTSSDWPSIRCAGSR